MQEMDRKNVSVMGRQLSEDMYKTLRLAIYIIIIFVCHMTAAVYT